MGLEHCKRASCELLQQFCGICGVGFSRIQGPFIETLKYADRFLQILTLPKWQGPERFTIHLKCFVKVHVVQEVFLGHGIDVGR